MRKLFFTLAIFVMALCANAQTNQYFWYQGSLMMGNPIAQIDSVTFGEGEPVDTLHILLPHTIIKMVETHDTVEVHDTIIWIYAIHDTICPNAIPEGALAGEFSVSVTKKVHFSQGNLQYVGTWQFAEKQWDYFGASQSNNHRDLFRWGTGNAPNNVSVELSDYTTFTDWGTNEISNGGNATNLWRTLTKDEWVYLFYTRENAATLFGLGNIDGVNGTILLPDNWVLPAGASFTASTTQGLEDRGSYYYNSSGHNFSHNTYTTEQWVQMETAGAVFLPAAGFDVTAFIANVNQRGHYWSATPDENCYPYALIFDESALRPLGGSSCNSGLSVRLVRNVE